MRAFKPLAFLLLLAGSTALLAEPPRVPYQVGERLSKAPASPTANFREVTWEQLLPPIWTPADAFKGFDLAKM